MGMQVLYSFDNKEFNQLGEAFNIKNGFWKGIRPAMFCYNENGEDTGSASFDDFTMIYN